MKRLALLCSISIFLFTACSDNARLNRKEDRLIGFWEFEKATFKEDGALFRDNITDDFEGDVLEFYSNYEAVYDDVSAGILFFGDWELILDRDSFDGEEDVEFFLDMRFFDEFNRPAFDYFTSVTTLTNNRLELIASNPRGRFTFKLRRIE